MFRDLKEYQEIAKIYAEKVSKPENLEEMTGGLGVQNVQKMRKDIKSGELNQKPEMKKDTGKTFIEKGGIAGAINRVLKKKPTEPKVKSDYQSNRDKMIQSRSANRPKSREEVGLKSKPPIGGGGRISRSSQNMAGKPKPTPSTAEIRAKAGKDAVSNIPKAEGSAVIDGKKINPDFGKKVEIKKEPVKKMNPIEKRNRERLGDARVDALKKKNAEFQAAKKSGNLAQFRKDNPKMSGADRAKQMAKERLAKKAAMEEYTPYDIVLEYLLSSEQAATIEEANYIMTEMDAETIQSIVSN